MSIISVNLKLVSDIKMSAPTSVSALRAARLTEEPMSVCKSVVSVVIRDMISPEWFFS